MSSAVPGRHPDDDLLADLAAEVLPESEARTVEAHVIGCPRCADLLGEAERMRRLLVAGDPGPMPPDVLARIEAALESEAQVRSGGYTGPMAPVRGGATGPWDDQDTWTDLPVQRHADEPAPATDDADDADDADRADGTVVPMRPRRTSATRGQSRRDLRGDRDPSFLRRHTGLLAGAAGIVVLVGMGGFVVRSLTDGGDTTTAGSALESAAGGAGGAGAGSFAGVRVTESGTAYRSASLVPQVRRLVAGTAGADAGTRTTAEGGSASQAPGAAAPSAPSRPTPASTPASEGGASQGVLDDAGSGTLRDPQRLQQCLAAVGQPGARPLAVDFATYDGREAAIIVLPARGSGYEVWAVDPSCGPDGAGILAFKAIAS